MITHEEIDERTAFHPPASSSRRAAHEHVRELIRATMHVLLDITPPGRDQSIMMTHLEDAMMRANRALALAPDPAAAHEPAELRDLPPEARRLLHAVDAVRDQYAEADEPRRAELWGAVHAAADAVWDRHGGGRT
jgi:hypothetical protein